MGLGIDFGAVSKVCRRIIICMTEDLILFVPDSINAVNKFHIFRKDSPDRERMDPCAPDCLFFQSRTSCNGIVDRHILKTVHLLEIGAQAHEQQAG